MKATMYVLNPEAQKYEEVLVMDELLRPEGKESHVAAVKDWLSRQYEHDPNLLRNFQRRFSNGYTIVTLT